MTEPIFETIKVNDKKGECEGQVRVECKTDVLCEDVSKILSVTTTLGTCQGEELDGKLKYNGRVVFYVIYLDVQGNVNKCECITDYHGDVECSIKDAYAKFYAKTEKEECDLTGNRLTVSAYVTVKANLYANNPVKFLIGGDDFILDKKELSYVKSYGVKKGVYPVEEEFTLNYALSKILCQKAKAHVTAVQCGVGCIIVDGELYLSLLLLQNIEKSDIIREERTFPFRMEIEYEQAMPVMTALARVSEKSYKTDVTVDGDSNTSKVNVSVNLCFEGEAFSLESVTVPTDLFCTAKHTETERECIDYLTPIGVKKLETTITCRCQGEELPAGCRLMSISNEKVEVLSYVKLGDKIEVTGVASATAFFKDTEGKTFSANWLSPFETLVECELQDCYQIDLTAFAKKPTAKILSINEAELEIQTVFSLNVYQKGCFNFVKSVKYGEEKRICDSAISVYIAREGEDLWSLAKRLNVCPDELVENNKELQFPLTGEERIVVYRQK